MHLCAGVPLILRRAYNNVNSHSLYCGKYLFRFGNAIRPAFGRPPDRMSMSMSATGGELRSYAAAAEEGRCLVELPDSTEIVVRGRDASNYLHRLCSADIRPLNPGEGLPAFFLDARGRAVALVDIYRHRDGFELASARGQSGTILDHLQRYRIREEVIFEDVSAQRRQFRLVGKGAAARLQALLEASRASSLSPDAEIRSVCDSRSGDHGTFPIGGNPVTVRCLRRGDWDAFALVCKFEHGDDLVRSAAACGVVAAPLPVWDAVRIELGLPEFGRDISPDCLGPEVSPDPRAISTAKGCYLGQETVARLEAHGHLNRKLRGLLVGSEIPAPGTELLLENRPVGRVTSAVYSPCRGQGVGLAMVRREAWDAGTVLVWQKGEAVVTDLPMTPWY